MWPLPGIILLGALLWTGCSNSSDDIEPDEPLPFPPPNGNKGDGGIAGDAAPDSKGNCPPNVCNPGLLGDFLGTPLRGTCLSFEEVHEHLGLITSGSNSGVVLTDFDKDGRTDLFILKQNLPNELFRNTISGFKKVNLNLGNGSRAAAWKDFDSDGDLDLVATGDNGTETYRNNAGQFSLLSNGILDPNPGRAAIWIGMDLLLATENGTRFYQNQGNGIFQENSLGVGLDDYGDGAAFAVADYDGDGKQDIYLANSTGVNRLFRNKGNGSYESVESQIQLEGQGNNTDAVWVPFNGDSLPSLYLSTYGGGNQFFIHQTDNSYKDQSAELGVRAQGNTTRVAMGDVVNKGQPAIFLGRWDQTNLLYLPKLDADENVTGFTEVSHSFGMDQMGQTIGAQWFDYNQDGNLDLIVVMADGGIFLYQNRSHSVCENDE